MNEHHRDVTAWGTSFIPDMKPARILDIGCGGGMLMKMMAVKYPRSKVDGIDISEESVKATLEHSKMFHSLGRLDAVVADVSDIPFPDGTFDLVTAVETYFFWPDLAEDIRSAVSKMKVGGIMCIVSEMYIDDEHRQKVEDACKKYHMKIVDNDTLKGIMENAGLDTDIHTDSDNNWVSFIGIKRR